MLAHRMFIVKAQRRRDQGDTIVEVIFAVAIFAAIMVGALSIMNQGITTSQRAVELTQVTQEVSAQAEALRLIQAAYAANYRPGYLPTGNSPEAQWQKIIDPTNPLIVDDTDHVTAFRSEVSGGQCDLDPGRAHGRFFVIDLGNGTSSVPMKVQRLTAAAKNLVQPPTYARIQSSTSPTSGAKSYGIWIEAERQSSARTTAPAIDFHIRACWSAPGTVIPMTTGTIVRLYEPR